MSVSPVFQSQTADNDGVLDGPGMFDVCISVFQSQIADNDGVLDGPGMFDVCICRVSVSDSGQ